MSPETGFPDTEKDFSEWRRQHLCHREIDPPLSYEEDDAFGSGAISEFPGRCRETADYMERVCRAMTEKVGVDTSPFDDHYDELEEAVKMSYVSGRAPLYAALRWVRMKAGEIARTLDVPSFPRSKQLFMPVGVEPENFEEEAITGEELRQDLYRAEAEEKMNAEEKWPTHPGMQFAPYEGLEVVRLR